MHCSVAHLVLSGTCIWCNAYMTRFARLTRFDIDACGPHMHCCFAHFVLSGTCIWYSAYMTRFASLTSTHVKAKGFSIHDNSFQAKPTICSQQNRSTCSCYSPVHICMVKHENSHVTSLALQCACQHRWEHCHHHLWSDWAEKHRSALLPLHQQWLQMAMMAVGEGQQSSELSCWSLWMILSTVHQLPALMQRSCQAEHYVGRKLYLHNRSGNPCCV